MAPKSHPIDNGYAWAVCLGCAIQQFFIQGGLRSLGILFIEIVAKYDANPTVAALAMALVAAGFSLFAALGNGIGRLVTYRKVTFTGGLILHVSLILTAFAPNIYVVIIFLGLGSGMATGLMFGPSLVVVGQYFDKRRALANGLALSGGSIGQLVIPAYLNFVIRTFGFQGGLILYAGLVLHSLPGALLLRPPEFFTEVRPRKQSKKRKKCRPIFSDSSTQTWSERGVQTSLMLDSEPWFSDMSQVDQSTQADIPSTLTRCVSMDRQKYQAALLGPGACTSQPNLHRSVSSLWLKRPSSIYSSRSSLYHAPFQESIAETEPPPAQPTARPGLGLFFKIFFKNLFDKEVLGNPLFWMFAAASSFGHSGYINALMFLPSYSVELQGEDMGKRTAALLLSVMGVADLVGRIGGGLFADAGFIRRTWLCGFCYLLAGVANVLMPLKPVFGVLITYAVFVGIFGGTYMALLSVIVVDLCGQTKLSAGIGLGTMIMGLFVIPIPSALGFMSKAMGSYAPSVQLCGGLLIIAFTIYLFDPCCWKLKNSKEKERERERNKQMGLDDFHSSLSTIHKPKANGKEPRRRRKRRKPRPRDYEEYASSDGEEMDGHLNPLQPPWATDPENTAKLAAQIVLQLQRYGQGVYTPEEMARISASIVLNMNAHSSRAPPPSIRGPGRDIYDIPETVI